MTAEPWPHCPAHESYSNGCHDCESAKANPGGYIPAEGDRVRIRRYVVSGIPQTRELDSDVEATIVARGRLGATIDLDPATAVVHYSEGHVQPEAPFGLAWRVGLGYVFLGGSPKDGTTATLVTEVEHLTGPGSLAEAIDATPPGHAFADRELLNVTRMALSRIYSDPCSVESAQVRECARQALARLEGRTTL